MEKANGGYSHNSSNLSPDWQVAHPETQRGSPLHHCQSQLLNHLLQAYLDRALPYHEPGKLQKRENYSVYSEGQRILKQLS